MGISKLNSFFTKHHRIIFGVFAILIIIAFVFADFIGGGGGCSMFGSKAAGKQQVMESQGQTFNMEDLNAEMRMIQLGMTMQGFRLPEEYVQQLALQSLQAKALAKRYNIVISDDDVAQEIFRNFPDKDGKFDKEAYKKFVDNFLTQYGFTEDDLNEMFRQRLLTQKLADIQGCVTPVSEAELQSFYFFMNQRLDVRTATIYVRKFEAQIKVDENVLKEFFEKNRDKFEIPAVLNAKVVVFAPQNYIAQVEVSEDEIKSFYEANKDLLAKVKDKDNKDVAPTLEQAREQITGILKNQKALEMVKNAATNFSNKVYKTISEGGVEQTQYAAVFDALAQEEGLAVIVSGKFSANAASAGVIPSPVLVKALAQADGELPLTEAVSDNTGAYVALRTEYIPPHPAEYADVAEQVKMQYIQTEAAKLARQYAEKLLEDMKKLSPADRLAAMDKPESEFKSMHEPMPQGMLMQIGLPAVTLKAGEFSDITENKMIGCLEIYYLAHRLPPAEPFAATDELKAQYKAFKTANSQTAFAAYAQANSKITLPQTEQQEQAAE